MLNLKAKSYIKNATKIKISREQEKYIAENVGGEVQPNSGGTKFGGGDILTNKIFIEAKCKETPTKTFSIKKEWLDKCKEQAFEQGKEVSVLAFQFRPFGKNYFILAEEDFVDYVNWKEGRYGKEVVSC